MKANTDKQIEKLVDKMMKETSLDKPSSDFTSNVMAKVLEVNISTQTIYKPLISKWVWFTIFIGIAVLIAYLSFGSAEGSSGFLNIFNFDALPKLGFSKLFSNMHFSKTTTYACILLVFMLFIQIPVLKHYMDKRLEI